jgi:hypothetical protein
MPLAGGPIRELHTTAPGDQIGSRANDGRYLAWIEIGVFGAKEMAWRLFATDLADAHGEVWQVDSGPGTLPWIPIEGPPVAISAGWLAYARYVADGTDWRNELVVLDLGSRVAKTVADERISSDGHITAIVLEGDSLLWTRRMFAPTPPQPSTALFEASVSSGTQTRSEIPQSLFQIGRDGDTLVATTAQQVLVRRAGGSFETLASTSGIPMSLVAVAGRAYWVDTGTMRPVSASLVSPSPAELDTAYTLLIFSDGKTVAWWTRPDVVPGQRIDHFYVNWIPAPP